MCALTKNAAKLSIVRFAYKCTFAHTPTNVLTHVQKKDVTRVSFATNI